MGEFVTLELPKQLASQAREVAEQTHRRLEDVLVEWLDRGSAEQPVESLTNAQVLALANMQLPLDQQEKLSDLLAGNREGSLTNSERAALDELMQVYRRGLVRKAQAIKEAVSRGLQPPLN
jgi:hypothetical protein